MEALKVEDIRAGRSFPSLPVWSREGRSPFEAPEGATREEQDRGWAVARASGRVIGFRARVGGQMEVGNGLAGRGGDWHVLLPERGGALHARFLKVLGRPGAPARVEEGPMPEWIAPYAGGEPERWLTGIDPARAHLATHWDPAAAAAGEPAERRMLHIPDGGRDGAALAEGLVEDLTGRPVLTPGGSAHLHHCGHDAHRGWRDFSAALMQVLRAPDEAAREAALKTLEKEFDKAGRLYRALKNLTEDYDTKGFHDFANAAEARLKGLGANEDLREARLAELHGRHVGKDDDRLLAWRKAQGAEADAITLALADAKTKKGDDLTDEERAVVVARVRAERAAPVAPAPKPKGGAVEGSE